MVFSSWKFIILFLPFTLGVFFTIPERFQTARKLWLVAVSLFFYSCWKLEFLPLVILSIGFNYMTAEWLCRSQNQARRRGILSAGVIANLALLGYFKYTNFFAQLFGFAVGVKFAHFDILLPLAISFFTFTQISYVVDVFRNRSVHYGFLDYTLFVSFFPHLIAGPIVRHWEIIPQFAGRDIRPNLRDIKVGLTLFMIGLFKKVLLADPIGRVADTIFNGVAGGATLTWFDAWFGALAFTVQLYFDFSGYSDMAIGLARFFSIKFPHNFASPYKADSPSEFWRRWHVTLTRFLREYVYFPLGGNRCGNFRQALNIMGTMLVSGLWHGAGLTFVAWGCLHGAYLVIEQRWRKWKEGRGWKFEHWFYRIAATGGTFLAVLCGWVLFRADSFKSAGKVFESMVGLNGFTLPDNIGQARLFLGTLAPKLGATLVPPSIEGLSYSWSVHGLFCLLAIIWLLPNSQQMLAAYEPVLEKVPMRNFSGIKLKFATGFALGAGFFWVVRTFFSSQTTPFLYFNF
jgi:D-alanyl-lipoteichoic acid acyltransferase DltB (MBOAT superfamily)